MPDRVGSAWNRQAEVDVVGINWMQKTIILGECKWTLNPIDTPVLAHLVEKASRLIPQEGKWQAYFLGFSRSGWSSRAIQFQKEIIKQPAKGQNWHSVGLRLLDLAEVDRDLAGWCE